jgi:hypothetical protein
MADQSPSPALFFDTISAYQRTEALRAAIKFGMAEIFPNAQAIAHDGFGNHWVVDLVSWSKSWGPIFFVCHDAPVCVYQTDSLVHFIEELLRFANPPHESELDFVHDDAVRRVWDKNPDMMSVEVCRNSSDAALREFAWSLDECWLIYDMRRAVMGDGFSWGRYRGGLRRFGEKRIFAYEVKRSLLQWLFGW